MLYKTVCVIDTLYTSNCLYYITYRLYTVIIISMWLIDYFQYLFFTTSNYHVYYILLIIM